MGQKSCLKNLNARENPKHIHWEVCMKWSTGSTESLSLALFLLFDPLPYSLFRTIHHQAHKPLPQQLERYSFCPSWWEETLFCNMVKIFQVFYHPEQDHRKLLTTFPCLVRRVYNYIMQIFYAFLCILFFLLFPISFKLLPLCTSELCWSQRSNGLKTCVQVKWLHLWPQTIPSWEHLICSNQMYFYFNGMLFAWGKLCGSPSDVFSFYHFVEKCINPFCFTSGIFFNTALGFSLSICSTTHGSCAENKTEQYEIKWTKEVC